MFVNTWGYALVDDLANSCHADPAQIIEVDTVDGRNPAPVEVGSFSHYLQAFFASQVVVWDFFH